MNDLLIGLLSALVATNTPLAMSNLVQKKTGLAVAVANPNDPLAQAVKKLMEADDAAQAEVDRWIQERQKLDRKESDVEQAAFRAKLLRRFEPVKKGYESFLEAHPNHAEALLAYGSFLNDIGEEEAAEAQWEKARNADPKNPATWNNLANQFGHNGDVKKAFGYYAKAIELEPDESVYYQNLATTVFLFRKDAMEHYQITEAQVFEKAMALYQKALALDPQNFRLAAEVAQTYYGIRSAKGEDTEAHRAAERKLADEAMAAWRTALKLADNDLERESVHLHLTRWQINTGRYKEAQQSLNLVTNETLAASKKTLTRRLAESEGRGQKTNAPAKPPR